MGGVGSGRIARPVAERFWEKVDYHERGCWIWTDGPQFWAGFESVSPRRWAWEESKGPIPKGRQVRPLCKNLKCVRPAHLYLAGKPAAT
jgi:hypothetical protein